MADKDFKVPSASLGRKSLEGAGHMPSVEDETVIKGAHSDTMVPKDDTDSVMEASDTPSSDTAILETFKVPECPPTHPQTSDAHNQAKTAHAKQREPSAPPLPYTEPGWSQPPTEPYTLTVIKNGAVVQELDISRKPFHVFGRLPVCDVTLEHPSVSRYHAVLQYRPMSSDDHGSSVHNYTSFSTNPKEAGFYVYDLSSTHGTFLNKSKIQPRCYYRLRVGQLFKLGGSSRLFVLEEGGMCESMQEKVEEEAKAELQAILHQKEEMKERQMKQQAVRAEKEDVEITWGIVMEDVAQSSQGSEELQIDPEREAYYRDDPKKALKKFFDREGLELEYESEEEGPAHARAYTIKVRLPIDTATGEPVYAEASMKGKKKEAVVLCALNACRLLDSQGMLRKPSQGYKRKVKNWEENEFYDSDEDTFLDRTGDIEKRRKQRMKRAGKVEEAAETYQTLRTRLADIQHEVQILEDKLAKAKEVESLEASADSLDDFMKGLGNQLERRKKVEIKHHLHELKKDEERVIKLIEMVQPTELPSPSSVTRNQELKQKTYQQPLMTQDIHHVFTPSETESQKSSERNSSVKSDEEMQAPYPQTILPPGSDTKLDSPVAKKQRFVGPSLPPPLVIAKQELHVADKDVGCEMSRKQLGGKPNSEDSADYSSWLPPTDQTGDGRTHLNEKYGY